MMYLRGLALLTLFLPGTARRRFRIEDSHHDAQQSNTSTNAFEGSAFNPFRTGRTSGKSQKPAKSKRLARPLMQVWPMENTWVNVQGRSLRTWSFQSTEVEQVEVLLSTGGGPLEAVVELWNGPDNTPMSMRVYGEDGQLRPFKAVIGTRISPSTVTVRNIGQMEWPIAAMVSPDNFYTPSPEARFATTFVQGGSLRTFSFEPSVESVEVLLGTDGRPLDARLELLQGPNSDKQVVELYIEDGLDRPCSFIIETPGSGNVVRVVNTGPVAFPMYASVVPNSMNDGWYSDGVIMGGGW